MKAKFIIIFISVIQLLTACNNSHKEYLSGLKETKLDNTNFRISIPTDYVLEKSEGPDFDNYYFYPADTPNEIPFYGGIYIGFATSRFPKRSGEGKIKELKSPLFENTIKWTLYEYNDGYFVQAIIDHETKDGLDIMIHVFGSADSEDNLKKLLWIFGSLNEK